MSKENKVISNPTEDEVNPNSRYERLVEKQISWLGHLLTWLGIFVVLITISITVYSYIRVESIEEKVNSTLKDYENKFAVIEKELKTDFRKNSTDIDDKQYKFESKSESKIDNALKDLENKFDKFSGLALLQPKAEILYKGEPLNSKTITIDIRNSDWDNGQRIIDLRSISIRNSGGKKLEGFNIILKFDIGMNSNNYTDRVQTFNNEKSSEYRFDFRNEEINPDYSWYPPYDDFSNFYLDKKESIIHCSMEVYYSPSPTKISFSIKVNYLDK